MCGIVGIINLKNQPMDLQLLQTLTSSLAHRGPDAYGCTLLPTNRNLATNLDSNSISSLCPDSPDTLDSPNSNHIPNSNHTPSSKHTPIPNPIPRPNHIPSPNHTPSPPPCPWQVGFGHRRLAILDLSSAATQPLSNEDDSIWLTYNGEIYNFLDLKQDLQAKGHIFQSNTDSEVLIHGYESYGESFLNQCNGMFAFALWDANNSSLWLGRDRLGKKPLFYLHTPDHFVFASELSTLLLHPAASPTLDIQALSSYLLHDYVPAPQSLIQNIKKLMPGQWLKFSPTELQYKTWWQPRFNCQSESLKKSLASPIKGIINKFLHKSPHELPEAIATTRRLLIEAVERRLQAQVPLGVFLSGGLDSSCLIAALAECTEVGKINTYSIGFKETLFDESPYALMVARHFGCKHKIKYLHAADLPKLMPEALACQDEPFADASILPTYVLCKFAKEEISVALGGDGGDELFAGYDPFLAVKLVQYLNFLPPQLWSGLSAGLNLLPGGSHSRSWLLRAKRLAAGMPYSWSERLKIWQGGQILNQQKQLLKQETFSQITNNPLAELQIRSQNYNLPTALDRALHYFQTWYLPYDILTKVDRASMSHALEVRAPFLDVKLVEYINSLPPKFKLHGLTRKYLLRQAFAKDLPVPILQRPKQGFGIPLSTWFRSGFLDLSLLDSQSLQNSGIFKPEAIQQLLQEHLSAKQDHHSLLWNIYCLAHWHRNLKPSSYKDRI